MVLDLLVGPVNEVDGQAEPSDACQNDQKLEDVGIGDAVKERTHFCFDDEKMLESIIHVVHNSGHQVMCFATLEQVLVESGVSVQDALDGGAEDVGDQVDDGDNKPVATGYYLLSTGNSDGFTVECGDEQRISSETGMFSTHDNPGVMDVIDE